MIIKYIKKKFFHDYLGVAYPDKLVDKDEIMGDDFNLYSCKFCDKPTMKGWRDNFFHVNLNKY